MRENRSKSDPRAFRTKVPAKNAPKMCWERARIDFGGLWEPPGCVFAVFWVALGHLLAALGRFLRVPGCLLSTSWLLLGISWSHLGVLVASRLDFEGFWVPPNHVLVSSGTSFGFDFRIQCVYCCTMPSMDFTYAFPSHPAARRYVRSTWN